METQESVIQAKPVTLSDDDQAEIITFIKQCHEKGLAERKPYMDHAKECEDAYHCRMKPIESPELDWMSNICLPWAFDAAESWYAHIHSTTIPQNDQIFTISGRTIEDHPGADIMQQYLEYCFERNEYPEQLGQGMRDLAIKNHCVFKIYWRKETTMEYPWTDEPVMALTQDPLTGEPTQTQIGTRKVRRPKETVDFNNVWIDVIDIENFVMYPIHGDINKTTRIHENYRYYEDLMATADKTNYFNLDQLSLDDEKTIPDSQNKTDKETIKQIPKGLNIKEAWIDRVKIGDKIYRNYIATMVNDKVLIRFQPFPPDCPKSPFVFTSLRPDGRCLYGYGLLSKALGILEAANKKFNGWIDEGVITQHGAWVYWKDSKFNPQNVVRRPGALIEMTQDSVAGGNLRNLIDDLSKQQQAMADLAALKVEFETITVPKVVKGMIETGRDATATEINQAQNNSNGKMHIDADTINRRIIKPSLQLSYQNIYYRAQFDQSVMDEIQKITQPKDPQTGQPLGDLPILPLPEVDIKIVGYKNVIRKENQLMGLSQAVPMIQGTPSANYIKYDNYGEDIMKLLDLDTDRLWMSEEERKQADDQANQQQDQQTQFTMDIEKTKLQLQKEKQDQDHQIRMMELQLEQQKFAQNAEMAMRTADREDAAAAKQTEAMMDSTQVR